MVKLLTLLNTTLNMTVKHSNNSNNIFNNSFTMEDIKVILLEAVVDSKTVKMSDPV
tara:strand:+ start:2498 stop:2665 length:168 start_codon:yes stop_codon:yes gene_type:complete